MNNLGLTQVIGRHGWVGHEDGGACAKQEALLRDLRDGEVDGTRASSLPYPLVRCAPMDLFEHWNGYRARNQLDARGQHPVDIDAVHEQLVHALGEQLGLDVAPRFELPVMVRTWWQRHGAHSWVDDDSWRWLHPASSLARVTVEEWDAIAFDPPVGDSLWAVIGGWSDKHIYMVCCDRTHPWFGSIADFYDNHPWWGSEPYSRYADLAAFFADQESE